MYIRDFKYTPEDVDCQFCTEFINERCRRNQCPWLKERVEAGVVTYAEAVVELFSNRAHLMKRIKIILALYDKSFWRDEEHFKRFKQADASFGFYKSRNTNEYYAALFLLTADSNLFRRTSDCFHKKGIDFSKAKLGDISPENYALFKIAKSLYMGLPEVSVDELADPELVETESFHLVINSMLIYRCGLSALHLKNEGATNGLL